MIYTKNLQLYKICTIEPFKGRLIDGLSYLILHPANPFYFAPFPIDWFEKYEDNEEHGSIEFKKQWRNRNKYIILFWAFLVLDILVFYLLLKQENINAH
jgi:hypothetical protein